MAWNDRSQPIEIHGFTDNCIAYCEAQGLSKCFQFYANHFARNSIMTIGFNSNSGYTYIALEDENVSICSSMGSDAEILVTNFEDGEEKFFETYDEWEDWVDAGGWDGDKWGNYTILQPDEFDIPTEYPTEKVILAVQNTDSDDVVLILLQDKDKKDNNNYTWRNDVYCDSSSDFVVSQLKDYTWGFDDMDRNQWFDFESAVKSTKQMCYLMQQKTIDLNEVMTEMLGESNV